MKQSVELEIDNARIRLNHLKELQKQRKADYMEFGKTDEDALQDAEIAEEISELKRQLKHLTTNQ